MAKQVGCYLVGAAGWWSSLSTKMEDCLRIKPAERKVELRRGERQIPKDRKQTRGCLKLEVGVRIMCKWAPGIFLE